MLIIVINVLIIVVLLLILYTVKRYDLVANLICRNSGAKKCSNQGDDDDEDDNRSVVISEVDSQCSSVNLATGINIDDHSPLFNDSQASSHSMIKHRVRDLDSNHHRSASPLLSSSIGNHNQHNCHHHLIHNSYHYQHPYRTTNGAGKHTSSQEAIRSLVKQNGIDLVSMAERGKICKHGSMDGASYSSESATPDTEEEASVPFLNKRAQKASGKLKTVREASNFTSNHFHNRYLNRQHSDEIPNSHQEKATVKKLKLSTSLDKDNDHGYSNDAFDSTRMLIDSQSNGCLNGLGENGSSLMVLPKMSLSEDGPVGRYGAIQVTHAYDPASMKLFVSVIKAVTVPTIKDRFAMGVNNCSQLYVKLILLPYCKQKFRTKTRNISNGLVEFKENFTFSRVPPEEAHSYGLRYRFFTYEKLKRDHCLGECVIPFATHKPFQQETKLWLNLEASLNFNKSDSKSDVSSLARSDSTGSNHSMQKECSPELLLGLSYNGTTGRLQVTVIRGSQMRSPSTNRPPDTFVKLSLVSFSGQEISRSKTSVRRGQPNPHFKESFIFPVTLFQLPDVTLVISVYNKRSIKRRELIGWFSLGRNNTGEEERAHWADMKENRGEQICRWHVLLDT